MVTDPALLLLLLLAGHALCDYPLQGDFLSRGKNRNAPIQGFPWWQALYAHSFIHGGMVASLTGSAALGLAEIAIHSLTDFAKCEGRIGFNTDQGLHIACKLMWWIAVVYLGIQ